MEPAIVVPGHGATGDASLIENSLKFHQIIYKTVEELYEEGVSDFEMKPAVAEALAEYSEWEALDEALGRLISISYLEVEENNF